jgi:hypothetical protein
VAALAICLFFAGLPAEYAHYHNPYGGSGYSGPWKLEPDDVSALEGLGVSVGFYALYNVAIEVVQTLTRRPYPSDLTDQEWTLLKPLLASPREERAPPKWPHAALLMPYSTG